MSEILRVDRVEIEDDRVCVVALVDDALVAQPQTYFEPAEYGAALCRGAFYLDHEEVIPEDDDSLRQFVADRVGYWEVLDVSDS